MYNIHQHWDPLKVCAVGKSYPPEFYSFIQNPRVRGVMERIAIETEEDYQKLINLLETFNISIIRNDLLPFNEHLLYGKYMAPPMTPRDYTAMIGDTFFMPGVNKNHWDSIKGASWPTSCPADEHEFNSLPSWLLDELNNRYSISSLSDMDHYTRKCLSTVEKAVVEQNNSIVYNTGVNSAAVTRIGKDLYFGTESYTDPVDVLHKKYSELFPDYRCHIVNTGGHSDATFCAVVPGLIVSLYDVPSYADTFPGWEIIYLPNQSWDAVRPFLDLKEKNYGKWWVPGEELNNDFTEFVENWLGHWVGYVEETVFDVNMLVIDEKNVVCNNYNEEVFKTFDRFGITPHIVNFRHRYFWDGGLHCITSDLHREGTQKDYFPERRLT